MGNLYTPNTLAKQVVAVVNQYRNPAGGSVPATLENIVWDCYEQLWECWPWRFRQVAATLTAVASTSTVVLPDAFEKLDQKWCDENNDRGPIVFTTDLQAFEARRSLHSSQDGEPVVAYIRPKTSETSKYVWEVIFAPTPRLAYTYHYIYLRLAPALEADKSPLWPSPFHRGWKFLTTALVVQAFVKGDDWKGYWATYASWLERAKSENDEVLTSNTPVIKDGYGDVRSLTSVASRFAGGRAIAG